ncbi:MAG: multidrug effflux MFS transporter [Gammaproteobacteria bacterium]|nr:multidrug effflux MFS transporter [Gammaproteobacteria bacterium]
MKQFTRYALLILAPCAIFQPLGMDIFVSVLPGMIDNLGITEQQIQFLLVSFVFASSLPQLIMGKLSDLYGRRPLLLLATLGFALTSYLCTIAHDLYWFTMIRFFHGLSAATTLVVVYAIIRDLYHGEASAKMYSYVTCILALTAMFAPLLGAILSDYFQAWEATFRFLAVFACFALGVVFFVLPETHARQPKLAQIDVVPGEHMFKTILTHRVFWTFVMCATTTMTGLFLYFSIGSIILMKQLGISSYGFSILFGLNGCTYFLGNYLSTLCLSKFKISQIVLLGNGFVCLGAVAMLVSNYFLGLSVVSVVCSNLLITLGGGLSVGPATSAALEPFPNHAGTASGIFGAIQYGLPALIGLVVTRFAMTSTLPLAVPILILSLIAFGLLKQFAKRRLEYDRNCAVI